MLDLLKGEEIGQWKVQRVDSDNKREQHKFKIIWFVVSRWVILSPIKSRLNILLLSTFQGLFQIVLQQIFQEYLVITQQCFPLLMLINIRFNFFFHSLSFTTCFSISFLSTHSQQLNYKFDNISLPEPQRLIRQKIAIHQHIPFALHHTFYHFLLLLHLFVHQRQEIHLVTIMRLQCAPIEPQQTQLVGLLMDTPNIKLIDNFEELTGISQHAEAVLHAVDLVLQDLELLVVVIELDLEIGGGGVGLVQGEGAIMLAFVLSRLVQFLDVEQNLLEVLLPLQDAREVLLRLLAIHGFREQFFQILAGVVKRPVLHILLLLLGDREHIGETFGPNNLDDLTRLLITKLLVELSQGPPQGGVEVVLDAVVGPAREHLRNLGPFVTIMSVGREQFFLFFLGPGLFHYLRVQVVMPASQQHQIPFPNLFLRASGGEVLPQHLGDVGPFATTKAFDQLHDEGVVLCRPVLLVHQQITLQQASNVTQKTPSITIVPVQSNLLSTIIFNITTGIPKSNIIEGEWGKVGVSWC